MIKLLCQIPLNNLFIACSGGRDSMFAVDFVMNGGRKPTLVYINHGTEHGAAAEEFVKQRAKALQLELLCYHIERLPNTLGPCHKISNLRGSKSPEEHWRDERYKVFKSLPGLVLTAHHLDDALEWWVFSSLHGTSKLIPVQTENVIRPFLATPRETINHWVEKKNIKYIDDPSNDSRKYMRNIIRHDILPNTFKVNPGFDTVIRKKYLAEKQFKC